jgi:Domain of unknown function (DUF4190)
MATPAPGLAILKRTKEHAQSVPAEGDHPMGSSSWQPVPYGARQPSPYGKPGRATNSLAITALSCGIAQIIAGPLATIPAIVCGFMSLGQIRRSGEDGRGMAKVGLTLGIIGLALEVLAVVLLVKVL